MNELTHNNWSILDKFDLDLPLSSKLRRIAHVQREFPHFPQELLTLRPFFNLFSKMGSKSLRSHIPTGLRFLTNVTKTMKLLTQFDGSYTQVIKVKQVVEFSEPVSENVLNVF